MSATTPLESSYLGLLLSQHRMVLVAEIQVASCAACSEICHKWAC